MHYDTPGTLILFNNCCAWSLSPETLMQYYYAFMNIGATSHSYQAHAPINISGKDVMLHVRH